MMGVSCFIPEDYGFHRLVLKAILLLLNKLLCQFVTSPVLQSTQDGVIWKQLHIILKGTVTRDWLKHKMVCHDKQAKP